MSDERDIILTTGPLGGLGDHAIYTTLPQRFTELGYKVYLDQDNLCRNDEITDLLWANNPYIIGTSNRKPNAGYTRQGQFYEVANRFPLGSVEAMERAHGLPPPYSLAPKIYYKPKPFSLDLSNAVLVDFSSVSSSLIASGLNKHLLKLGDRFIGKKFIWVTFPDAIARQPMSPEEMNGEAIRMNSIYEYVDALSSCYGLICSEAGAQSLAAAVRGEHDVYDMSCSPEIVCLISTKTFNSRGYTYRGVDYRVTLHSSNSNADYWDPHEVDYERYQLLCRRHVEAARSEFAAAQAAREALA